MMAIASTSSSLCCSQLLLLIALGLYFFAPPLVQSGDCVGNILMINEDLEAALTYEHNFYRSMVNPVATDMMRMVSLYICIK